jgi:hypothetical protein
MSNRFVSSRNEHQNQWELHNRRFLDWLWQKKNKTTGEERGVKEKKGSNGEGRNKEIRVRIKIDKRKGRT